MVTTLTEMGQGLCRHVAPLPSPKGAAVQRAVSMQDTLWSLASAHLFPAKPLSGPWYFDGTFPVTKGCRQTSHL